MKKYSYLTTVSVALLGLMSAAHTHADAASPVSPPQILAPTTTDYDSVMTAVAAPANTPPLFVYEGAGCTGVNNLPQFRAFLGRQEDGATDFTDYTSTPAHWVTETTGWELGCWQGQVKNLSLRIPLAFDDPSPVGKLSDVAAGKLDSYYTAVGNSIVSHGFPNAYLALGWEENGNWYPWTAVWSEANFHAAFAHIYKILKAIPGNHFTIWFNPTIGWEASVVGSDYPGTANLDGVAWDVYADTYLSAGAAKEPTLWNNEYSDSYGIDSIGPGLHGFFGNLPTAVPEFGVGSRGDGHGAPDGTVVNGGDDPYFMTNALTYFAKQKVKYVGYWDYNAGDYNSKISDGSRPKEALAFLKVFGSPNQIAIFTEHATPFTTKNALAVTATNCNAVAHQTGPKHWEIVVWATEAHPTGTVTWVGNTLNADLYDASRGTSPIKGLGKVNSYSFVIPPNHPFIIAVQE